MDNNGDKGKQKVIDSPEVSDEEGDDGTKPATCVVKFSEDSLRDLTFEVADVQQMNVVKLRSEIRSRVGGMTSNRRLRLIHAGKVLNTQTSIAEDVARIGKPGTVSHVKPKIYIHCSVGDILTAHEMAEESDLDTRVPARSTLPELRGFDRLRSTGFSDEDINNLREQFQNVYGTNGDTDIEDRWIDTGVEDPEIASALNNDYLDDLIGILMGMFLGVFVVFLMYFSNLFSARLRRAMIAGGGLNFCFAFLRQLM